MKKTMLCLIAALLAVAMLAACGNKTEAPADDHTTEATEATEPSATGSEPAADTTESTSAEEEDDTVYEGDAATHYIDVLYHEQIARYHTALSEKWDEGMYYENEMSALPYYYYEGDPLENVGFGFVDLDNDGYWELVIGAIMNAEQDPAVFEIWTLVDGEPVMLAQGGHRNRYILQYVEEDGTWYVVNEGSNSAANSFTDYLMLSNGNFVIVQGIVLDAIANEQEPWFMAYDLDHDGSNDTPIDEETAMAILESNREHYTALEYFPYIYFR